MKPVLLILTGGTIGSLQDADGHNTARAGEAVSLLQQGFCQSDSPWAGVQLETCTAMNVLSENMTPHRWSKLAGFLKQVQWNRYEGIVLAHGTDTLGFSACFLSLILAGAPVPVCLISSDYNLTDPRANGLTNFRAAIELIAGGLAPDVYVPYRNENGTVYLHRGAHLHQCGDYTADFFSADACALKTPAPGGCFALTAEAKKRFTGWTVQPGVPYLLSQLNSMQKKVLYIKPYVGLDYANIGLEGVQAVVHGLYHASTACAQIAAEGEEYDSQSLLSLLDRCREKEIPVYLQPCNESAYAYASTGLLLKAGARALWGMTPEMTYVKTWLAVNLGLEKEKQEAFLKAPCNREFIL